MNRYPTGTLRASLHAIAWAVVLGGAPGTHETLDGYHDDCYISSIIMMVDTDGVRMPERIKAGTFVINGVSLRFDGWRRAAVRRRVRTRARPDHARRARP